jgi:ATP-dependent Clp protease adapter protein ClpS
MLSESVKFALAVFVAIIFVPLYFCFLQLMHPTKRPMMSLARRLSRWLSTSVQSTFGYPVRVPGSPPISDEVQLTSYLIQTPDLSQTIKAFGSDPAEMLAAIARCGPAERGSIRSVLNVVHGTEYMKVPQGQSSPRTPRNLFVSQIRRGTSVIRPVLERAGVDVRSLMFYIAHGVHEADSPGNSHHHQDSSQDPAHDSAQGSTCGVEILNDDFTPMEFVVYVLSQYLGMAKPEAIKMMLEVHHKGSAILPQASMAQATQSAVSANAVARRNYFPLFLRVVAGPTPAADAPSAARP